jgi:hypothetical protein
MIMIVSMRSMTKNAHLAVAHDPSALEDEGTSPADWGGTL